MSFLSGIGKILQGKPVFEADTALKQDSPILAAADSLVQGPKTMPIVQIRRVECHTEGSRMDLFVDIHNDSSEQIFLDKILLLGTKQELDTTVRPGEARQFRIFSGERLTSPATGYAEIQYRRVDGDYFSSIHQIRSRQEPDRSWSVNEFILQLPIRDVR